MAKMAIVASFALLVFSIVIATPRQSGDGLQRQTTSTISTRQDKERGVVAQITNRRFSFTEFFNHNQVTDENRRSLLLEEEFKSEHGSNEEGQTGTVTVKAWIGVGPAPSTQLWTFSQEGDEGAIADRFYRVTKYGCCGAEKTSVYFNLSAGHKVFTSSADLFQIEVPNTYNAMNRYVGFVSDMASLAPGEITSGKKVIGIIEYGSEDTVLDRLTVSREVKEDMGTPTIEALYQGKRNKTGPLDLWGSDKRTDPAALSGFSMVFSYSALRMLTIPVTGDRFDVAHARLSRGFSVQRVKQ